MLVLVCRRGAAGAGAGVPPRSCWCRCCVDVTSRSLCYADADVHRGACADEDAECTEELELVMVVRRRAGDVSCVPTRSWDWCWCWRASAMTIESSTPPRGTFIAWRYRKMNVRTMNCWILSCLSSLCVGVIVVFVHCVASCVWLCSCCDSCLNDATFCTERRTVQ